MLPKCGFKCFETTLENVRVLNVLRIETTQSVIRTTPSRNGKVSGLKAEAWRLKTLVSRENVSRYSLAAKLDRVSQLQQNLTNIARTCR